MDIDILQKIMMESLGHTVDPRMARRVFTVLLNPGNFWIEGTYIQRISKRNAKINGISLSKNRINYKNIYAAVKNGSITKQKIRQTYYLLCDYTRGQVKDIIRGR